MHVEHFYGALPGWCRSVLAAGHNGVPVFFVLSGFVIANCIGRTWVDGAYCRRFVLRRMIRLNPPYWASVVLALGLALLSSLVVTGKVTEPVTFGAVLAHLFYLQDILGIKALNPAYWTLCLEAQFYVSFCLLMWGVSRFQRRIADNRSLQWIFLSAAIVASLWPLRIVTENVWPGLFFPFWHGFLLGAFAYWVYRGRIRRSWFYAFAATLLVSGIVTASAFPVASVVTSILLLEVARADKLCVWLNWHWVQLLGACSYSIYLLHMPLLGAGFNAAYRVIPPGRVISELQVFALVLSLIFLSAFAFWKWVEQPCATFGRRWTKPAGRISTLAA